MKKIILLIVILSLNMVYGAVPTVTTQAVTNLAATTATGNGNITSTGGLSITQYGVCWGTTTTPTIALGTKTTQGAGVAGAFTSSITGLTVGTLYYVRAYATNSAGTSYGTAVSFTLTKPTVTTSASSSVSATTATGNGNITNIGSSNITQYGVCWSNTNSTPTISDNITNEGTRAITGTYTSSMTGLPSTTLCYVRAYATNSTGTGYGTVSSFTTYLSGAGTSLNPYLITNFNDLKYIYNNMACWAAGKYLKQTANIDASASSSMNAGAGWSPIGASGVSYFGGNYDGQNYTISNLFINRNSSYQGLFGYTLSATISNLGVTTANITGGSQSGALAGYISMTNLTNCYSSGTVNGYSATIDYVGGLIGQTQGSSVTGITSCYSSASISVGRNYVGSLAGYINTDISACYSTGNVTVTGNYVGGLIGNLDNCTAKNSYSTGNISGSLYTGGLVGYSNAATISKCYSTGTVSGSTDVGGLVGQAAVTMILNSYSRSSVTGTATNAGGLVGQFYYSSSDFFAIITNSFSTGSVGGAATNKGGLIGYTNSTNTTVNASFWDTQTSGLATSSGGTGFTTTQMTTQSTFTNYGWNFTYNWVKDATNNGYPHLSFTDVPIVTTQAATNITATTATGNGTIENIGGSSVTQYGVCWSTSQYPTTASSKTAQGAGSAAPFTSSITGITSNTTYYVRAYATNSLGTDYGEQVSFLLSIPTVTTQAVSNNVSPTAATGNGTIVSINGATITQYGVCWSTNQNPTIADNKTTQGAGTAGAYTSSITGLTAGTTYYVRAYATNSMGTGYGDQVSFAPIPIPFTGSGTVGDPYLIANLTDLRYLSEFTSMWATKYFKQTANIDASSTTTWNSDGSGGYYGWSPIGIWGTPFSGNYDGQGYYISGLYCNRPATNYIGLIGVSSSATISNLGLTNVNFSGSSYVGGLIGSGYSTYGSTITNCYTTGNCTAVNGTVGGLVGSAVNNSIIRKCYSSVNVSSAYDVGGLVGLNTSGTISNCFSRGDVTRNSGTWTTKLGGFVGTNTSGTIKNCYSTGKVQWQTAPHPTNLGFAGAYTAGTMSGNFWDTETSLQTTTVGTATGTTTAVMKTQSTFTSIGWNFDGVWIINASNNGYPNLTLYQTPIVTTSAVTNILSSTATGNGNITSIGGSSITQYGVCWSTTQYPTISNSKSTQGAGTTGAYTSSITGLTGTTTYYVRAYATNSLGSDYGDQVSFTSLVAPTFTGSGTVDDPYLIATLTDLRFVSENSVYWSKYMKQTANIDATTCSTWNTNAGFSPIGNSTTQFTGNYDGQGCYISNLFINRPATSYIGLFGYSNGTISNLGVTTVNFTGATYVGGLLGYANSNATINNCYTSGACVGTDYVGGLLGYAYNYMSYIANCYSRTTVTRSSGTNSNFGGFVGYQQTTVKYSYSTGRVYQSAGVVWATADKGFAGYFSGTSTSNFWDKETSSQTTTAGTATGTTTALMKTQSTFTNVGWNFNGTWVITGNNDAYPSLSFALIPTVTTQAASSVASTSATGNGNITSIGGASVTQYGVCWSTNQFPTTADNKTEQGSGTIGAFTSSITGLSSAITYYARAYAINSLGTGYGDIVSFITPTFSGAGTVDNPYLIANLVDLRFLSENSAFWTSNYKQTANIDATETSTWNSNGSGGFYGWSPIGNNTRFTGTYNGQGYSISNLYMNRPTGTFNSLFGYINLSTISNLSTINVNFSAKDYLSGFIGISASSTISNCSSTGTVTGTVASYYTGGFIGYANTSTNISNCYSTVNGAGGLYGGGFVGYNSGNSIISNCYSRGSITRLSASDANFGGFVGNNASSTISNSYSTGRVYQSAGVDWATVNKGFAGAYTAGAMSGNFWNTETSLQTSTSGVATGKTTTQMTIDALVISYITNIYLAAGWDFKEETPNGVNNIWNISTIRNDGYPHFDWQFPNDHGTLPVELTSFSAKAFGDKIILNWQTATEVNNYGFEIEKSIKNDELGIMNWNKIGFVKASGNSNSPKTYSFYDDKPSAGIALYRLKQVDNDGTFSYSKEVEVNSLPTEYTVMQNFPNPFNPTTKINFSLPKESVVTMTVYNSLGQKVSELINGKMKAGYHEAEWNASQYPSGVYFYNLTAGSFQSVKKMILVK